MSDENLEGHERARKRLQDMEKLAEAGGGQERIDKQHAVLVVVAVEGIDLVEGSHLGERCRIGADVGTLDLRLAAEQVADRHDRQRLDALDRSDRVHHRGFHLDAEMTEPLAAVDVIRTKRDGAALSDDQIEWVIDAYTRGVVADEQMSALAMAILLNGMSQREIAAWTAAMIDSGRRLDFGSLPRPTVDKHSTGGVGDLVSLVLGPIIAASGGYVPMISGRGLGHTGGTLDKLESIPGFTTALEIERFTRLVRENGLAIVGQTDELAPADRRIYAVRDITATVDSPPLMISSILSKKLAEGLDGLVLDIKFGGGAFTPTIGAARTLAGEMTRVAAESGVRCSALLTDMNAPLAPVAGNALEIGEAIRILQGDSTFDGRANLVLLNDGSGNLAASSTFGVGNGRGAVQLGDVDGDGDTLAEGPVGSSGRSGLQRGALRLRRRSL